jgi:hypothetical protein
VVREPSLGEKVFRGTWLGEMSFLGFRGNIISGYVVRGNVIRGIDVVPKKAFATSVLF